MKSVEEVLKEIKGEGKENEILTGKAPFSQSSFDQLVHAMVNDTSYKIPQFDPKTGEKTGEINISQLIRGDLQKTIADAKYPQKSESAVLDSAEIATKGLSRSIGEIVLAQLSTGKKFPIPARPEMVATLNLADVPGSQRTVAVRDPQTQVSLGTAEITTQPYKQVRAHSPAPEHKKKTVRIPPKGNKS